MSDKDIQGRLEDSFARNASPLMLKAKEYGAKLALQGLPEDVVRAKLDEYLENVRKFERDFGDDDDI